MDQKIEELTKQGGVLDQYKERQRSAWNANYAIWGERLYYSTVDYDEEFETLRTVINTRREWFNENIDKVGEVFFTVSYEIDGEIVKQEKVRGNSCILEVDIVPEKEGYIFEEWVNKETERSLGSERINSDVTYTADFLNLEEVNGKISMYFSVHEEWVPLENEVYDMLSIAIYPSENEGALRGNIQWTSSNEKVATIEDETVYLHSVGDATITGRLFDGTSNSYILHVYDNKENEIDEPTGFVVEREEYTVKVGDTNQIVYHFEPNMPINPDNYIGIDVYVENDEIIEMNGQCLSFIGLKEGKITVTLEVYSSVSDDIIFTKEVTINVKSKSNSGGGSSSSSGSSRKNKTEEETIWSKVDDWALEEMKQAEKKNLIPETFKGKDFTSEISREDFCAVAVKLYEALTSKKAEPVTNNPFVDTNNEYVLKAYNLGITNGVSATEFANGPITREQMATMMARAYRKAGIDIKVDLDNVVKFVDDNEMHDWGRPSIYAMVSKGIIKGMDNNKYNPLGNAKIEEALAIALRCTLNRK